MCKWCTRKILFGFNLVWFVSVCSQFRYARRRKMPFVGTAHFDATKLRPCTKIKQKKLSTERE